jgi:transcriptional regulator of acetoin/glycerol metabolism
VGRLTLLSRSAAEELGLSRAALYRRLEKYGIGA